MAEAATDGSARTAHDRWPETFVTFYEGEYLRAVRIARLIVGRVDLAEELVQEVFLRIAGRWSHVEHSRAYLRRCVINAATRLLDRQRRERDYVRQQLPDVVPPPEVAEVLAALDSLSPRRRAAIVLRFYEDLSDDEIADALGCRPATVRSLVHRALRQLEKELS